MRRTPERSTSRRAGAPRLLERFIDFSGAHAWAVLAAALAVLAVSGWYAARIELRSDFLELLPRDSPGFKAFEHQASRVAGGASLIVINASPDRKANEAWIDALQTKLEAEASAEKACTGGPPRCLEMIGYVESGTKEVRRFFETHKWLYADKKDLGNAEDTLDDQIAVRSGLIADFDDPPASASAPGKGGNAAERKPALGMDEFRERWEARAKESDDFPTGYFATDDGSMMGVRIVSNTRGMGEATGDRLFDRVKAIVKELNPKKFEPRMEVGYAGDIPNAVSEKESLMSQAIWATLGACVLILAGIVFYFRSLASLAIIGLPALLGVGAAYSFANATFGYVNTSGAFLGAIILGNGINYPIVLLARYREFVSRGMERVAARREAVLNAFRAELVGATVGGIAYGSLVITDFRGFSQFGTIGFVGMLLVWLSMIPVVPALIVVTEGLAARVTRKRLPDQVIAGRGGGPFTGFVARVTERAPRSIVVAAVLLTALSAWRLPAFFHDPWEYNFANLGSKDSADTGAGLWSNRAEKVFGGKTNIAGAMMLADTPDQVPLLKKQIFENDALDPQGTLVDKIATVSDLLPGDETEQREKLEILGRLREKLSDAVLQGLSPDERARTLALRPPPDLGVVTARDLPLLRRRFEEKDGTVGTVFYVKFKDISFSDGHNLLRIAKTTDNVTLPGGKVVLTASRSTIFAQMIKSMTKDGPLATFASLFAVMVVVAIATHRLRGGVIVVSSLILGVVWAVGFGVLGGMKLNFLNFIALPITFGIGCEYPFNLYDRSRLLGGDVTAAVTRAGGAVALCSFTTTIGYGALLVADNQALQSFGKLAMSGEIACLLAALFVLPSLLHLWKPSRAEAIPIG